MPFLFYIYIGDVLLVYGHQGLKEKQESSRMTIVSSAQRPNGKISVSINKERPMSQSPLYHKYDIQKYDLHPNYSFAHLADLIPKDTPYYIDSGQHYVERIVRALYYFKQCSLIGPSGTGKTHIVYLVAELTGLPVWEVNCGLSTSAYDLIGINFDYTSVGEQISSVEVELLRKRAKVDEDTAYKIIQCGAELRRQYKAGDVPYGPSLGDLINWATLVQDGNTPNVAAEETIIALTSDNSEVQDDIRRVVESIFPKPQ